MVDEEPLCNRVGTEQAEKYSEGLGQQAAGLDNERSSRVNMLYSR